MSEPKSAEEWAEWAWYNRAGLKDSSINDAYVEAIRRAQEQARREAIEKCAKIAENLAFETNRCPAPEIRALLKKK